MKVPYYQRIADTLRSRIESKKYYPGEIIPSEKELAHEFGVSVITVRKALGSLVEEGLVERRAGIGTTVINREEDPVAICLSGDFREWFDSVSGKSPKLTIDVLGIEITDCPDNIANILKVPADEDIWLMRRIRRFRGEAISYYMNYCSPEIFKDVDPKVFEKVNFLEVLQKQYNNRISRVEQKVRAVLADMDLADLLEVEFGVPLFFGEVVYYLDKNTPVEVTNFYFRGDRYVFFSALPLKNKSK